MTRLLQREEILRLLFFFNGIICCLCDGGWTAYHDSPPFRSAPRRHRNTPVQYRPSYHGHYDMPPYPLSNQQRPPLDSAYYPTNHRQAHSYIGPSRYNNNFAHAGQTISSSPSEYHSFGPTSYSSLTNHGPIEHDHDKFSSSPVIITSSENPLILSDDTRPYSMGHLSIVTANPLSLGPSHAGFLSASSSLRVADHFSKPNINKGYKVIEDESDERSDDHTTFTRQIANHKQQPLKVNHHQSSNDRSSSVHPTDSKATSFQSFILHSFKSNEALPKKLDDAGLNEISHKN